jgi:hypothetical protein
MAAGLTPSSCNWSEAARVSAIEIWNSLSPTLQFRRADHVGLEQGLGPLGIPPIQFKLGARLQIGQLLAGQLAAVQPGQHLALADRLAKQGVDLRHPAGYRRPDAGQALLVEIDPPGDAQGFRHGGTPDLGQLELGQQFARRRHQRWVLHPLVGRFCVLLVAAEQKCYGQPQKNGIFHFYFPSGIARSLSISTQAAASS